MDAQQSNLSSAKYGYDMVVATTQVSINTTMKEFLSSADTKEINICYAYDDNGDLVQTDYQTLVSQAGIDPYSIASGNYHKTDPVAKLDNVGFAFAFKAQMGLPAMDPSKMPDIVVLNKGSEFVTYQLYCQEFSILNLQESGGGRNLTWTNISQPDDAPWILSMTVNIDLRADNSADAFSKLPPDIQKQVKNLNPDSAFSVQQLLLDLSTRQLDSLPNIVGLDKTTDAYTYLQKVFVDTYFGNLTSGDVVLGYAVTPENLNPNPVQPSIIPTDLNIMVSPSMTATGDPNPQDQGMYTLNYLVMTENHNMPAPVPFTWNWVEDTQAAQFHGTMSINRNIFVDYLNKKLSEWLPNICYIPKVTVTYSSTHVADFSCPLTKDDTPQTYTMNPSGSTLLTFNYAKSSKDQAGLDGDMATLELDYTAVSTVSCNSKQLIIETTTAIYVDVSILSGHGTGYPLKYQATLTYDLDVDATGTITVAGGSPDVKDLSDSLDTDTWVKVMNFFSGGGVDKLMGPIAQTVHADTFVLEDFDSFIQKALQNNAFWVFPGGKTFSFADVFFSDNQDMVAHITYADAS